MPSMTGFGLEVTGHADPDPVGSISAGR